MESNDDIDIMTRVKSYLDAIPSQLQNKEYCDIVVNVDKYIAKYCRHNVICDSIDIDVEYSKTIYYCEKCLKTFDIDDIFREISAEINYARNICDMFIFYNERLMKILDVSIMWGKITFNCSYGTDNIHAYDSVTLGINVLAGCRFEGNVLWLCKTLIE